MENGDLPVRSFAVEGYRGIRRLSLPTLGNVNLFVGKNNAGKTSLLEALTLFEHRNARALPVVLMDVLRSHSDLVTGPFEANRDDASVLADTVHAVEDLFAGFFSSDPVRQILLASAAGTGERLTISVDWASDFDRAINPDLPRPVLIDPRTAELVLRSEANSVELPFTLLEFGISISGFEDRARSLMIPAAGLDSSLAREIWDEVALSGEQDLVEDALRPLVPGLERVVLVGENKRRTIMCRIAGATRPVPIRSLGDGAIRVFGLAAALAQSRGGTLLIDEIESGLHYSVQQEVWSSIFFMAETLGVQVFATSHSWDTVVAFQDAANRSNASGMLYRLERGADGSIYAEQYSEQDVARAAEYRVEVR